MTQYKDQFTPWDKGTDVILVGTEHLPDAIRIAHLVPYGRKEHFDACLYQESIERVLITDSLITLLIKNGLTEN